MRILSRTIFSAVLLLAFTGVPALAQTKIATVDLEKIFHNYYKTKLATAAIQEREDDLQKDDISMTADLKKRSDQYEQLLQSANDQAVSEEERDKRRQSADDQFRQLQDSKLQIEQFERQAQATIADQQQRMRDSILAEIKKTVADKAKAAGDTLVMDTTGQTMAGTSAIIYSDGNNDLTDVVLKELNATAPPDLPDSTSPAPVFVSTNNLPYGDMPGSQGPATGTPPSP
jgi:outer membrane protein